MAIGLIGMSFALIERHFETCTSSTRRYSTKSSTTSPLKRTFHCPGEAIHSANTATFTGTRKSWTTTMWFEFRRTTFEWTASAESLQSPFSCQKDLERRAKSWSSSHWAAWAEWTSSWWSEWPPFSRRRPIRRSSQRGRSPMSMSCRKTVGAKEVCRRWPSSPWWT